MSDKPSKIVMDEVQQNEKPYSYGTDTIETICVQLRARSLASTGDNEFAAAAAALKSLEAERDKLCARAVELERSVDFLDCLESCGVDNWEGYDDAREMFREEND